MLAAASTKQQWGHMQDKCNGQADTLSYPHPSIIQGFLNLVLSMEFASRDSDNIDEIQPTFHDLQLQVMAHVLPYVPMPPILHTDFSASAIALPMQHILQPQFN
eukprot:9457903-Ditylum_brightwellii.AAC.2